MKQGQKVSWKINAMGPAFFLSHFLKFNVNIPSGDKITAYQIKLWAPSIVVQKETMVIRHLVNVHQI